MKEALNILRSSNIEYVCHKFVSEITVWGNAKHRSYVIKKIRKLIDNKIIKIEIRQNSFVILNYEKTTTKEVL